MLSEGFNYNLNTKNDASPTTKGLFPLDPRDIFASSNNLHWRSPCMSNNMILFKYRKHVVQVYQIMCVMCGETLGF